MWKINFLSFIMLVRPQTINTSRTPLKFHRGECVCENCSWSHTGLWSSKGQTSAGRPFLPTLHHSSGYFHQPSKLWHHCHFRWACCRSVPPHPVQFIMDNAFSFMKGSLGSATVTSESVFLSIAVLHSGSACLLVYHLLLAHTCLVLHWLPSWPSVLNS